MPLIISLGLAAAISWGTADYLSAHASKKLGPLGASYLVNVLGSIIFLLIIIALRTEFHFNLTGTMYAISASVFLSAGAIALFKGLAAGPVTLVSPISAAYPLVVAMAGIAFFQAGISPMQFVAICSIVLGIFLASGAELKTIRRFSSHLQSGPKWALAAAAFWGIGYALLSQAISFLGWPTATLLQMISMILALTVMLYVADKSALDIHKLAGMAQNKFVLGAATIQLVGAIAINLGLEYETASGAIITAISAMYPILTMALALAGLKEKVTLPAIAGALISVVGVVVLSLS
jgi:drug/metabolite transporter (DMT)-like permease